MIGTPDVQIEPTGETATIAGQRAERFRFSRRCDSRPRGANLPSDFPSSIDLSGDIWSTDAFAGSGYAAIFRTLQAASAIPGMEALTAGGRFPLRIAVRSTMMTGYEIRSDVVTIGAAQPAASMFEIPRDYQQVQPPFGAQPLRNADQQQNRHLTMPLSRDDAWALMTEYTQGESLRKHMLAVEAAVRGYARLFGEDEDDWGAVALLHDFDYERWPEPADHPFRGVEILKARGYPEWVTRAILSHADYSGVARESRLEHTLYACDEMSGFVTAAALVRPSQERARSRGVVGGEADEGQGVRARRQPRRSPPRRRGARPAARSAHQQCHFVHARAGRRAGPARHAELWDAVSERSPNSFSRFPYTVKRTRCRRQPRLSRPRRPSSTWTA